jgi:3-oxoadipate enol-lactonase
MPTMPVGPAPIAFEDTGPPPGRPGAPTVVFGHGLLFGGWMFDAQVAALRGRYRCVTVDWRGQGATPGAAGRYDMDSLTADAVGLIRALGVDPVHWVGLSMGGFVGARIAARHGELLRSLVLLDTGAEREDPARHGPYRRLAWALRLRGFGPVAGRLHQIMFSPAFLADPASEEVLAEWARRLAGADRAALRRAVLGVLERPAIDGELAAIKMPTLVAVGAQDRGMPPTTARRLAAGISGAELRIIDDCGHSSSLERPAAVSELLTAFLGRVDGA